MERLLGVYRCSRLKREVTAGDADIGDTFLFSPCPDGTIAANSIFASPVPHVSTSGYNALLKYLSQVFAVGVTKPMRGYVTHILESTGGFTKKEEPSRLFKAAESVVQDWEYDIHGSRTMFPTALSVKTLPRRRALWKRVWKKAVAEAENISTVHLYRGAKVKRLTIPAATWNSRKWKDGQPISVIERDDGSFLIREATADEEKYLFNIQPITRDGIVHGNRYLYMTKEQKKALGIGPELYRLNGGVDLKFTFDFVKEHRIIVERFSDGEESLLPTIPYCPTPEYYDTIRVVKRHVSGPIILPAEFCRRYDVQKDDVLDTEIRDDKLIIYGRRKTCSVCGAEDDAHMRTVPICPSCADVMGDVRESVIDNAGIAGALAKAKLEAAEAIRKIEEYERRT